MAPPESLLDQILNACVGYPRWLVAACATVLLVAGIWVVAKLLKWSLYLLMWVVLIGGILGTIWLVFH